MIQTEKAPPKAHDSSAPPRVLTPKYYVRMNELEEKLGWYRGMQQILLRLVDRYCGSSARLRILDVGCGAGGLLAKLRKHAAPGGLFGLDLAPEALQYCRSRNSFGLVQSSAVPLPFAGDSFDLITCADVLQHVQDGDDQKALEELFRALRPGGVLILRAAAGTGTPTLSFRYYRPEQLCDQLNRAGFQVEKATYINRLSYFAQAFERRRDPQHHVEGLPSLPPEGGRRFLSALWWKNQLVCLSLQWEAARLASTDRTYRHGMAVVCVARKPSRGN